MVWLVKMPMWGWDMTEGKVIKWFKEEGDFVRKGEPLLEVETQKLTGQIEALESGLLRKILAQKGAVVPVAGVLGVIADPKDELIDVERALEKETGVIETRKPVRKVKASPVARKIAEKHKIDIKTIEGTGPGGRIVKRDVMKAVEQGETVPPVSPRVMPVIEKARVSEVIPLKGMRKIVADRMFRSVQSTARVTLSMEVNATETMRLRERLLSEIEETNVRLSYTDILVRAAAKALREHPIVNSVLVNDKIHLIENVNVRVAVALEDGLIVPVVYDADKKSIVEIALTLKELAEKARKGKLSIEDATGGTFTITNLGMFGVDMFTPIINPPETAILGVGRILEKPVVVGGEIVTRSMMTLSLSFDHRVMDGVPAARFLKRVKQILENP